MMDGSEIQETVLVLQALEKAQAEIIAIAPDILQAGVVNHAANQPDAGAQRNALVEAAGIMHGNVHSLEQVKAEDLDALIIPGSLGFIKTITTYGRDGINFDANPALVQLLLDMHARQNHWGSYASHPF